MMGEVMTKLLETIGIRTEIASKEDTAAAILTSARSIDENGTAAAIILRRGIIE